MNKQNAEFFHRLPKIILRMILCGEHCCAQLVTRKRAGRISRSLAQDDAEGKFQSWDSNSSSSVPQLTLVTSIWMQCLRKPMRISILFLVFSLPEIFDSSTLAFFFFVLVNILFTICYEMSVFPFSHWCLNIFSAKCDVADVQNFKVRAWWTKIILAPYDISNLIFPLPHFTSCCFSSALIPVFIVIPCLGYTNIRWQERNILHLEHFLNI